MVDSFLHCCSPIYLFLHLILLSEETYPKNSTKKDVKEFTAYVSFMKSCGFRLTVKSLSILNIFSCMVWENSPVWFFFKWLSSFPNIIYWRAFLFLIVYSWLFCFSLIAYEKVCLFLGCSFCSIGLAFAFVPEPFHFDYKGSTLWN